jgi:hypothetical protein
MRACVLNSTVFQSDLGLAWADIDQCTGELARADTEPTPCFHIFAGPMFIHSGIPESGRDGPNFCPDFSTWKEEEEEKKSGEDETKERERRPFPPTPVWTWIGGSSGKPVVENDAVGVYHPNNVWGAGTTPAAFGGGARCCVALWRLARRNRESPDLPGCHHDRNHWNYWKSYSWKSYNWNDWRSYDWKSYYWNDWRSYDWKSYDWNNVTGDPTTRTTAGTTGDPTTGATTGVPTPATTGDGKSLGTTILQLALLTVVVLAASAVFRA